MDRFSARAVLLSSVDYGDADRIATLFTEERGRLGAFAAGARKSKKRFAGALEPFTLVSAQLVERRGELFRLEGADIVEPFGALREDLGGIARAAYACELVREVCREREPHPELFGELVDLLFRLSRGGGLPEDLLAFELTALARAGLRPHLSACAGCGAPPDAQDRFEPELGGILCAACARRAPLASPIAPESAQALRRLQGGDRSPLSAPIRREARAHLARFLAHHLGRTLRSATFMREVGVE